MNQFRRRWSVAFLFFGLLASPFLAGCVEHEHDRKVIIRDDDDRVRHDHDRDYDRDHHDHDHW